MARLSQFRRTVSVMALIAIVGTLCVVGVSSAAGAQNTEVTVGEHSQPSVSEDGRYLVYTRFVGGPGGTGRNQIFFRDLTLGTEEQISTGPNGPGDGDSWYGDVSNDGRYVVFESTSSNLVLNDGNGDADVFLKDRLTGALTVVSGDAGGPRGGVSPVISADGSRVAFLSLYDFDRSAGSGTYDVHLYDIPTGEHSEVSLTLTNSSGTGDGTHESRSATGVRSIDISGDGSRVAFLSNDAGLVPNDLNGLADAFVRNVAAGTTRRASVGSLGTEANAPATEVQISDNGGHVVFASAASNLVSADTNGASDVYLHDLSSGATQRVSVDSFGGEASGFSSEAEIGKDDRAIAFSSTAANLVEDDKNGRRDVFVRDVDLDTTERVSVSSSGSEGNNDSGGAELTNSASRVTFWSRAADLAPNDSSTSMDIFLRDLGQSTTTRIVGYRASTSPTGPSQDEEDDPRTLANEAKADVITQLSRVDPERITCARGFTPDDSRLCLVSATTQSTFSVTGRVMDARSFDPIGGATVAITYNGSTLTTSSQPDGDFVLADLPAPQTSEVQATVTAQAAGYGAYTVSGHRLLPGEGYGASILLHTSAYSNSVAGPDHMGSGLSDAASPSGGNCEDTKAEFDHCRPPGRVEVDVYTSCAYENESFLFTEWYPWEFYVKKVVMSEVEGEFSELDNRQEKTAYLRTIGIAVHSYAWRERLDGFTLDGRENDQCFMPDKMVPAWWGNKLDLPLARRIVKDGVVQSTQHRGGEPHGCDPPWFLEGNYKLEQNDATRCADGDGGTSLDEWTEITNAYYDPNGWNLVDARPPDFDRARARPGEESGTIVIKWRGTGIWRSEVCRITSGQGGVPVCDKEVARKKFNGRCNCIRTVARDNDRLASGREYFYEITIFNRKGSNVRSVSATAP